MLEIGVQENGTTRISFTPDHAGSFVIYYRYLPNGFIMNWVTLTVTGGTDK